MPNWMEDLEGVSTTDTGPEYVLLPEGITEGTITSVDFEEGEYPKIVWMIHYPAWDVVLPKRAQLNKKAAPFLVRDLKAIGVEIDTWRNLENLVKATAGMKVKIDVVTNKKNTNFQNYNFKELIGRDRQVTEFNEIFRGSPSQSATSVPFA